MPYIKLIMRSNKRRRSLSSSSKGSNDPKKIRVFSPTRPRRDTNKSATTNQKNRIGSHRTIEVTQSKRPGDEDNKDEEEIPRVKRVMTLCERPKIRSDGEPERHAPYPSQGNSAYEKPKIESDDHEGSLSQVPLYIDIEESDGKNVSSKEKQSVGASKLESEDGKQLEDQELDEEEQIGENDDDDEFDSNLDLSDSSNYDDNDDDFFARTFSHGNFNTVIYSNSSFARRPRYQETPHNATGTFKDQTLRNQNLPSGASVSDCTLRSCNGTNLLIIDCSVRNCNINKSYIEDCSIRSSNMNDCTVIDCEIRSCNMEGGTAQDCSYRSSNVSIG